MTDNIQHIDVDADEYLNAPAALREYARKLKEQNASLSGEVSTLRTERNASLLSGVLSAQGFKNPTRVQSDLLRDNIDPADKSAVEKWLQDNGDDYAKGAAPAEAVTTEDAANATNAAALGQIQRVQATAEPAGGLSAFDAAKAEITPEMTGEQIIALYKKHGV